MTATDAVSGRERVNHGVPRHPTGVTSAPLLRLQPVGMDAARITGGFWLDRQAANAGASIPDGLRQLHDAGVLRNFAIAAGVEQGQAQGPVFADSDAYKWLEAAAWEFARTGDEALLRDQLEVTATVAAAQQPDGYLDTVVQLTHPERYTNLAVDHELYCAGHLFQAAVAQSRATGHDELLRVAVRLADHLVATFGAGGREDVGGHPVVEMGLVELYRQTGDRAYLDLAAVLVERRGHGLLAAYGGDPTYLSDRVPVREAATVEGHAVRAVYLAAGAADVAAELGDEELAAALGRQFRAMVAGKQYVTGGLGARWEGEAFGDPYELPADQAYAETCAAIGGVEWAWRMLLVTGAPVYDDQIEHMLLNAVLSGVAAEGASYFYANSLHVRDGAHPDKDRSAAHGRRPWFATACCPPNVMRTVSQLAGYLATSDGSGLQLHQYADAEIAGGGLALRMTTDYPFDGAVRIRIIEAPDHERTIALRIPAWADGAEIDRAPAEAGTFASITRRFAAGDEILLRLPMGVRRLHADPRVDDARGQIALARGPLVYAVEQADQADGVVLDDVVVPPGGTVDEVPGPAIVDGLIALRLPATQLGRDGADDHPIELVAIPYFAWANRGPGPMRVWLPVGSGGDPRG